MALPKQYQWLSQEEAPKILLEFLKLYGVKEIAGVKHNPKILGWAKELGLSKQYTNDEIPWCGLATGYAAFKAGYTPPKILLRALAWNTWGADVPKGEESLGDVLTFTRDGGGHVGIYVGEDDLAFHVLGGNQGNAVSIVRMLKTRLSEARRSPWKIGQPANVRKIYLEPNGALSVNEA